MKMRDYLYSLYSVRYARYGSKLNAPGVRQLWIMATLPLLDGFFISFLQTGMWQETAQAAAFGVTALSGGACVIASMQLQGSLAARLAKTCAIYGVVAAQMLVVASLQTGLAQLIPSNLYLFTSIFLLGLGLTTTGLPWLRVLADWTGFEAAVKVMLVAALIRAVITPGLHWQATWPEGLLLALAIAWASGLALSLSGALLGRIVAKVEDRRALDWGAGLSLILMGLRLLGFPIITLLVLIPLISGYLCLLVQHLSPLLIPMLSTGRKANDEKAIQ